MRKCVIALLTIGLVFNTVYARAQQEYEKQAPVLGLIAQFMGATYTSVAIHECGHQKELTEQGIDSDIRIGLRKSRAKNGSTYWYLGKTNFKHRPRDPLAQSRVALAGMESTSRAFETLNEKIQRGHIKGRFSSMVAIMCKTDFPSYALMHRITNSTDQANDIEWYRTSTHSSRDFIYTAAALDILFSWQDLNFHAQRVMGDDPAVPRKAYVMGFETKPRVFVRRHGGIAIGFGLKKDW